MAPKPRKQSTAVLASKRKASSTSEDHPPKRPRTIVSQPKPEISKPTMVSQSEQSERELPKPTSTVDRGVVLPTGPLAIPPLRAVQEAGGESPPSEQPLSPHTIVYERSYRTA